MVMGDAESQKWHQRNFRNDTKWEIDISGMVPGETEISEMVPKGWNLRNDTKRDRNLKKWY